MYVLCPGVRTLWTTPKYITRVAFSIFFLGAAPKKTQTFQKISSIYFSLKFPNYLVLHDVLIFKYLSTSGCFRMFVTFGSENEEVFLILWLWLQCPILSWEDPISFGHPFYCLGVGPQQSVEKVKHFYIVMICNLYLSKTRFSKMYLTMILVWRFVLEKSLKRLQHNFSSYLLYILWEVNIIQ